MLSVAFSNCGEIRMGSPYNVCDLELTGAWVPDLPNRDWQDRTAASPDGRYIGLVFWDDTKGNEPWFRVVTLDCTRKTVVVSDAVEGCCKRLFWNGSEFSYDRSLYQGG